MSCGLVVSAADPPTATSPPETMCVDLARLKQRARRNSEEPKGEKARRTYIQAMFVVVVHTLFVKSANYEKNEAFLQLRRHYERDAQ